MEKIIEHLIQEKVLHITPLADGNFSHGFIIEGIKKKYFMRKFKHNVHGYDYPHDERWSFENSHYMMNTSGGNTSSYGVFMYDDHLYHIQDYFEGSTLSLQEIDNNIVVKMATYLANLHTAGKPHTQSLTEEKKQRLYARSMREYITNFEGILPLYETTTERDVFFKEFFKNLRDDYFTLVTNKNSERITTLHGDYWFGNVLYNKHEDAIQLIDFSICPYGEPGIDVGRCVADFELWSLFGNQEILMDHKKTFLKTYIDITGDEGITRFIPYMCKLKGLKLLSPLVQKFLNWNDDQKNTVKTRMENL